MIMERYCRIRVKGKKQSCLEAFQQIESMSDVRIEYIAILGIDKVILEEIARKKTKICF